MEFRLTADCPPEEITLDEFWDRVRAGKVPPTALYRDPWTEGRWDTVDNLRSFHRKSPVPHPPGPRLAARLAAEEQGRERDRELRRKHDEYSRGDLIERAFGVRPLPELAAEPGAAGAARLIVLPSFEPERVITIVLGGEKVRIEAAAGGTSLRGSLPMHPDPGSFSPHRISREEVEVARGAAPGPFRSPEAFLDLALRAAACRPSGFCLDGIAFRHLFHTGGRTVDAGWRNPCPEVHPHPAALLAAYADLLEAAGLARFAGGLR